MSTTRPQDTVPPKRKRNSRGKSGERVTDPELVAEMCQPKTTAAPRVFHLHEENAPGDAVYVGRPSQWGNPYVIGVHGTRTEVLRKFRDHLMSDPKLLARVKRDLRGKSLTCWCSPKPCHGDILLEVANGD